MTRLLSPDFRLPWTRLLWGGWLLVLLYGLIPASWFIQLDSVTVTDSYRQPGRANSRIIEVERRIRRDFEGRYRVEEQFYDAEDDRFLTVEACEMREWLPYQKDKALPRVISVRWWGYGSCGLAPDSRPDPGGLYRLCTWHYVKLAPLLHKKTRRVCSNLYRGRSLIMH